MADSYPVTVAVRRTDGSTEQVRVGTATKTADGFRLTLEALTISTEGHTAAAPARPASRGGGGGGGGGGEVFPNYGRSKGMPIAGASMQDLEFYANGARRTLSDPGEARFHDKERALLAAIEAEMARQGGSSRGAGSRGGGGGGMPDDSEIPPPGDSDRGPDEPF